MGLTEEFDYFVAGSDQIWSPYSQDVNDTMFLTFAPFNKRIAFAPSIAAEVIPKEKRELYKKYFEGFEEISVREYQSAQLVYEIVGKKAKTLIDPTLMLDSDEWKKIEQKPIFNLPERYLLVYLLGKNEYSSQIEKIGHDNNMEIINILADKRYQSIGPSQFVYMIKKASVVMTDSYHGTIFSILYKIPFVVCTRKGTSVNMNSRFDTLFEKFMIEHRMIEEINKDNLWTVDFDAIYQKLDKERKKVNSYLNRYLNVEK